MPMTEKEKAIAYIRSEILKDGNLFAEQSATRQAFDRVRWDRLSYAELDAIRSILLGRTTRGGKA
jgi:hypothetical protein